MADKDYQNAYLFNLNKAVTSGILQVPVVGYYIAKAQELDCQYGPNALGSYVAPSICAGVREAMRKAGVLPPEEVQGAGEARRTPPRPHAGELER